MVDLGDYATGDDGEIGEWSMPTDGFAVPLRADKHNRQTTLNAVKALDGYAPPDKFYSILGETRVGLDIETWDPNITDKGPGARRHNDGKIVGVGIGPRNNIQYYPVAHNSERNIQQVDTFWSDLRNEAEQYKGELLLANAQYDLDWLSARHGVRFPNARIRDVQIAEPLLDENKLTYKLNRLGIDYGLGEKSLDTLEQLYGSAVIKLMHLVDPGHAANYCKRDIELTFDVMDEQLPALEAQGLLPLFDLECRLVPALLRMRRNGVRVNLAQAEEAIEALKGQKREVLEKITHASGVSVDIWSNDSIAFAFDQMGLKYPKLESGRASFRKAWLEAHSNPVAQMIVEARGYDKIGGTFIQSYILNGHVDERIFCMFNQLRSDDAGTVSGRLSSAYPNMQNIPARHPVLGPLCRSMFIPEDGHDWGCTDWSQIEFRFLVHFAVALFKGKEKSATEAANAYINDPTTDFHEIAAAISKVPRKQAKNINFGVVYGMGAPTMAAGLGKTVEEAEPILAEFHQRMPFLKKIYDTAGTQAANRGYIKTILGRYRRFDLYETSIMQNNVRVKEYGDKHHCEEWLEARKSEGGYRAYNPKRAHTHKALNGVLQGSAADLMKKSMVDIEESGIFDVVLPHLTVHDELDVSVPKTAAGDEAFKELVNKMEHAIELHVPVYASANRGENWDDAKGD